MTEEQKRLYHEARYLKDLLDMCEQSPAYLEGFQWAVESVRRLRTQTAKAKMAYNAEAA